jgi:hypothetical protein
MIDLQFLAAKINDIIGSDKYLVFLKTNVFPDDLNGRNVVTMEVLRTPFGYTTEEFDAENMNVTLTFDLPTGQNGEDLITRDIALLDIQSFLLGWRSFNVEIPTDNPEIVEIYTVTGRFDLQPSSNPYPDFGRLTQQIVVTGTLQVQNSDCKAIVGNNVLVSINEEQLLKISRVSNLTIGSDNNIALSENTTLPEMQGISRISTKTLSFIYTGKNVEEEFLKIAEGIEHDVNKIYDYKAIYPTFEVEQKIKILNVTTQDSTGVYLQYSLEVQVVGG